MMQNSFLSSNTPQGFVGYFENRLAPMRRVFVLKGGPGTGKSTLMKTVAKTAEEKGEAVEIVHCSSDPQSLDCVILKGRAVAVVDGTAPHVVEASLPGVRDTLVPLAEALNESKLMHHRDEIINLIDDKKRSFESAYRHLKCALCQLNRMYACQRLQASRPKMLQLALSISDDIRVNAPIRKQFLSAITPDGLMSYDDFLDEKVCIGLRSSSRSLEKDFLNLLCGLLSGYTAYYCPFEPTLPECLTVGKWAVASEDRILERGLPVAQLINLDSAALDCPPLPRAESEQAVFDDFVGKAVCDLAYARHAHVSMEKFYVEAMNFEIVEHYRDKIIAEIFSV